MISHTTITTVKIITTKLTLIGSLPDATDIPPAIVMIQQLLSVLNSFLRFSSSYILQPSINIEQRVC